MRGTTWCGVSWACLRGVEKGGWAKASTLRRRRWLAGTRFPKPRGGVAVRAPRPCARCPLYHQKKKRWAKRGQRGAAHAASKPIRISSATLSPLSMHPPRAWLACGGPDEGALPLGCGGGRRQRRPPKTPKPMRMQGQPRSGFGPHPFKPIASTFAGPPLAVFGMIARAKSRPSEAA